jgi:mannose-6-phosphate isomerase-like protein (cupin superfamily)
MQRILAKGLTVALALSPAVAWTQSGSAPKAATYITAEEVQTVNKQPGIDRTIRVVDIGDQNFAVGMIHRGPTGAAAQNAGAGRGAAAGAAQAGAGAARGGGPPQSEPCGEQATGTPPAGLASGIFHEKQTEGYLITSGSGTMVTGGHIINGRKSAANADVTTTLNGPSCSGLIGGSDVVKRPVKQGDIVIIPAGVPHGWSEIPDHVDYLSFRPSDHILTSGYVHPSIKK